MLITITYISFASGAFRLRQDPCAFRDCAYRQADKYTKRDNR